MGAEAPSPIGRAEAKAFKVFMKKYIKKHLHQDENHWNWNGTNAWGKLTTAQKRLFAIRPKVIAPKRRAPIPKKKRPPKPKPKAKVPRKLAKDLTQKHKKSQKFLFCKHPRPVRS